MRLILCLSTIFMFISCATKSTVYQASKTMGHWDTRAQIRDSKKQKSTSLSIDFSSIWPDRLRAEVTGPFGVAVASLALNKDQMQLAIHTQKKYYFGNSSEKSLSSLMGMSFDPRILIYVLFDVAITGNGWICRNDNQGIVQDCKNKDLDISVQWSERRAELKRIKISRKEYEIQILVKDFSTKVGETPEYFKLAPPESYLSYKID